MKQLTKNLIISAAIMANLGFKSEVLYGSAEKISDLEGLDQILPHNLRPSEAPNTKDFCRINGYRDMLESSVGAGGPWILNFIASQDSREAAFFNRYPLADSQLGESHIEYFYQQKLDEMRLEPAPSLYECVSKIENFKKRETDQVGDQKLGFAGAAYFCSDVTILNAGSCSNGLNFIQETMRPVANLTLIGVWKEVFADPMYFRVYKKLSLQILAHLAAQDLPQLTMFDELNQLFLADFQGHIRASGINKATQTSNIAQAKEATWKSMAFFATAGANLANYIEYICQDNYWAAQRILFVIANGSLILDRKTSARGFLYSYPREINSLCDYGKNYHFWMSAYLAREVMKKTNNVKGSAAAAFTADKGYQFFKVGNGRDRNKVFRQNLFANYSNNIRLDLVQAAAGAWFGATSILGPVKRLSWQSIEMGIQKTFQIDFAFQPDLSFIFPSSQDPLVLRGIYSQWKQIIQPDAAYLYFENLKE